MSWNFWVNEKLNKINKYIELSQFIFNKYSIENKKKY